MEPTADKKAIGALLFLAAGTNALDVFSAVNSSPWTAYKFANDEKSVAALRKYVTHAIILTLIMCTIAASVAGSWWPIAGAVMGTIYMSWLYQDAVAKGRRESSKEFASP